MTRPPSSDPTDVFEHDLIDLLAAAFGRGASVEGVWEITSPVSHAPDWTVSIEKHEPTEAPSFEPQFLEE